jgi:hypothetical protein
VREGDIIYLTKGKIYCMLLYRELYEDIQDIVWNTG